MGAFLDHPKTEKTNEVGAGKNEEIRFVYGVSYMQGWRIDMEDAHCVVVSVEGFENWSFFAVFDGHAGSKVAYQSSEKILFTILETEEFKTLKARENSSEAFSEAEKQLVTTGITKAFLKLDRTMQEINEGEDRERSGTTAVMAILTPHHIIFANLGDSRGLLCRKSEDLFSTVDHKPYLDKERERIVKAGGSVMIQRVNGSLAVSRAFGDFEYKSVPNLPQNEQLVSPEPDVYILERKPAEDEFMVLACDGIYDVLENVELCEIIRSRLTVTHDLKKTTNQILDVCLSKGSRDNMTMILVVFDAAPTTCQVKAAEDKLWEEKIRVKIDEFFAHRPAQGTDGKASEVVDAELISSYLKEKSLDHSLPGGIHLARTLIDEALQKRMPNTQQCQAINVDQRGTLLH